MTRIAYKKAERFTQHPRVRARKEVKVGGMHLVVHQPESSTSDTPKTTRFPLRTPEKPAARRSVQRMSRGR